MRAGKLSVYVRGAACLRTNGTVHEVIAQVIVHAKGGKIIIYFTIFAILVRDFSPPVIKILLRHMHIIINTSNCLLRP